MIEINILSRFIHILMYGCFARTRESGRNNKVTVRQNSTVVLIEGNIFFLFKKVRKRKNIPDKLIRMVKIMYDDDLKCSVVDKREQTDRITSGIKL